MSSKKKYQIEFSRGAEKDFLKLDKAVQRFLWEKLAAVEKIDNPLKSAAKLVNQGDLWRWRFGDWRVIFGVNRQGKLVILVVLKVGHRREVYGF